jgi:hypothetical protein
MIVFKHKGNFNNTERFLQRAKSIDYLSILKKYGQEGVNALSMATPTDSGLTASSWSYEIESRNGIFIITWNNSNVVDGVPVAILIQYGHATRGGGYVQGYDYINPAIRPIFEKIASESWKEVSSI